MNARRKHADAARVHSHETVSTHSEGQSEKEEYLIEDFLRNKDVAPWFRGTSIFHLQGSNQLLNAIRDDTEQRTAHRVKYCLNMIGLDPMASSKDLKLLMRLSRGNDLAFLWFLMEMHYKNANPATYNVNEQLICSAICHLDMITTLREFDKILPRGHASRTTKSQALRRRQELNESLKKANKKKSAPPAYILPYFEKMRRPHVYGKSLITNIPNFKVNFGLYAGYADPSYVVHNESNRWYAEYDLNPSRRLAYGIIRNAISNIFENFEAAQLNANTVKVLCDYHKTLKEIDDNCKRALTVNIRNKCLKCYVGDTAEKKEERLRHVKESLHTAIEQQLCAFRKQTSSARKELTLRALTSDCDIIDVVIGGEYNKCCRVPIPQSGKHVQDVTTQDNGDANIQYPQAPPNISSEGRNKGIGDFVDEDLSKTVLNRLKEVNIDASRAELLMTGKTPSQISGFASRYMHNYDYGHVADTPRHSQTFFHAPTPHKPYMFDYRKIFVNEKEIANDERKWIRNAFLDALDKDVSTLNELQEAESKLGFAASECATKTWKTELAKHDEEERRNANESENVRPLKQYPEQAEYNAEDKNLMDQMLADAFAYLRQNPKFVLAQLPDAHKLPMLREWISRRYGKVYTPRQRSLSYRYSLKIFHALDRMTFDFPTPTAAQLGKNQFVRYNCRNYLDKKVKYIKNRFYHRLDNAIMKQSRNYWFAMRGYLCSNGPPRQTFFAYMPSRLRDIQRFRLWRSSEHRQDKAASDRRLLAKKPEQFME